MATTIASQEIDTQSRAYSIIVIITSIASLSSIAVVLRLFTRLKILRSCGLDDWTILAAQILALGTAVTIGLESKYGLGRHVWTIPHWETIPYLKTFYASILIYNFAIAVVKVSILLQYRRIFTTPAMQKACLVGLVMIICWAITQTFLNALICIPAASFWDSTVPGRCIPFLPVWYTYAVINVITDFSIFILPLSALKELQLPKRQKIVLFGVFSLGFFTCTISIIRIHTLKVAAKSTDPTWDNVDAATWSLLELCLAIVSACLPTLRPLIKIVPQFSSLASWNGPKAGTYIRHGISREFDVEVGTSPTSYPTANNSTTGTAALHKDADCRLQYLDKNNAPTSYNSTVVYVGSSDGNSHGTHSKVRVEKDSVIVATTVKHEFTCKK